MNEAKKKQKSNAKSFNSKWDNEPNGKKIVYENQATAQLRLRLRQRRSSDANDTATM